MAANALVQTRIDPNVKEKGALVLEQLGMTVSDAARILLTRTANEGALPFSLVANVTPHDVWFRFRVQQAIDDPRPPVSNEEVESRFARRGPQLLGLSSKDEDRLEPVCDVAHTAS